MAARSSLISMLRGHHGTKWNGDGDAEDLGDAAGLEDGTIGDTLGLGGGLGEGDGDGATYSGPRPRVNAIVSQ